MREPGGPSQAGGAYTYGPDGAHPHHCDCPACAWPTRYPPLAHLGGALFSGGRLPSPRFPGGVTGCGRCPGGYGFYPGAQREQSARGRGGMPHRGRCFGRGRYGLGAGRHGPARHSMPNREMPRFHDDPPFHPASAHLPPPDDQAPRASAGSPGNVDDGTAQERSAPTAEPVSSAPSPGARFSFDCVIAGRCPSKAQ